MKKSKLKFSALAAASLAVTWFAATPRGAAVPLKPGDAFAALEQFQLEGPLPDLAGKVLLVDFWASWCPPCKASFPALNDLHDRYRDKGLVVLAINVDQKKADMESFLKKTPAKFPVVRDAQQKLVAAAEVETMPTSFLVGRNGKIHSVHKGFRGAETSRKYEQELESLLATSTP